MTKTCADNLAFNSTDFRILILKAGFRSVAALGKAAGMTPGYAQQIARGLIPPPATRDRIAAALGTKAAAIWQPLRVVR